MSSRASKTDASRLGSIPRVEINEFSKIEATGRNWFTYNKDELRYDFILAPKVGETDELPLYVLFSGAADRARLHPPVFQRWSWLDKFDGHVLLLGDPGLFLDSDIELAWYFGTSTINVPEVYAELITQVRISLGVKQEKVVTYGSSGGGFAALQCLRHLPDATAVSINPQTDLSKYHRKHYEKFLDVCVRPYSTVEQVDIKRLSLLECVNELAGRRIVLVQNELDQFHLDRHYMPFVKALSGVEAGGGRANLREILFSDPAGHGAGEPIDMVSEILKIAATGDAKI